MSQFSAFSAKKGKARATLIRQLRVFLVCSMLPFLVMCIVVLLMLLAFNRDYATSLQNAATASEFNYNFKSKMDLDMYHFVVGSKQMDHLPLEEVERAKNIFNRLSLTTTHKENQWRIRSLLRLSDRLSERMQDIVDIELYDDRIKSLEHNIYVITGLMHTYMNEYIYDEVKELSVLQQQISGRVTQAIGSAVAVSAVLVLLTFGYSMRFTKSITQPIRQLCKKAERLGQGDFTVVPIRADNIEIQTLDDGFNEMVVRINTLLEHVREDQDALRKAELELLQAQINPHFLYNTFDSIIWLAEAQRHKEVVRLTADLSSFFRTSLSNGRDVITLAEERRQVESYLRIQQVRYHDILQYEIDLPDELLQYSIPKLTLQPLVENALYHGIKNKRGAGCITIAGRIQGQDILIEVTDNGAGMTCEQLNALRQGIYDDKHTGLGLVNVYKRLTLYYGPEYGLGFDSEQGVGSCVTVHIPKKIQPLP